MKCCIISAILVDKIAMRGFWCLGCVIRLGCMWASLFLFLILLRCEIQEQTQRISDLYNSESVWSYSYVSIVLVDYVLVDDGMV